MNKKVIEQLCINTIRFLAVDSVQKAKSGHPGMPLGAAPMAFTLWSRFLKYNPKDPNWLDRDRFILSAGHGCALLYSLLYLTGYAGVTMDDLKSFRQWQSKTPGHPEYTHMRGVEITTGPLGQGISNAVGMAIAEAALAAHFNRPGFKIIDHHTYVIASDGDLMEGVSHEASSLAGHLKLGKLIVLYDDNHITIEGDTELAFTENRIDRYKAYGWHTQFIKDGNDTLAIARAIKKAKEELDRPSFINIRTHIGFGSPHKQDTASAHGEPLGEEEVKLTKKNLGWPEDKFFYVPEEVRLRFADIAENCEDQFDLWQAFFKDYEQQYPDLAKELIRRYERKLPDGWDKDLPIFNASKGPMATRSASGEALNSIARNLPELMGGSADLAPSTNTLIKDSDDFEGDNRVGRNMRFGVREHAMGAILSGMMAHGGFVPYGATFLIFSDYMRPAIRLAALSKLPVIYIFTHDSIGLGEDGPTHQPVEHLLSLRAIPELTVIRPADANETSLAWKIAVSHRSGPTAILLTRQKIPILDPAKYPAILNGPLKGAYLISPSALDKKSDIILVASGSEVHLALNAQEVLGKEGINVSVVSFPCYHLFKEQDVSYRNELFPNGIPILAIEAGVSLGWKSYLFEDVYTISVDTFGASAPGEIVMREYGFNLENICKRARAILGRG